MEQVLQFLQPVLEAYGGGQGWLLQAITIIGSLRIMIKPIRDVIHTYVNITPSQKDNEMLKKMEESKIYKGIMYFVDWFSSVKPRK